MAVIVDASVLCAFACTNDVHYEKARVIMDEINTHNYGQPMITDNIFDEVLNVLLRKLGKKRAITFGNIILDWNPYLVTTDRTTFDKSWELFQQNNNLSLTDCSILATIEKYQITHLATFDKGFSGFTSVKIVGLE